MGDMNNLMNANEKLGPNPVNASRISRFCHWIKQCFLFDLGFNGPAYTWTNKRFASNPTFERLDRCMANIEWCAAFPSTTVYHLPMMYSDHAPILATLTSSRKQVKKPFKFENWWLLEKDFNDVAKGSWHKSRNKPFHLKAFYLASDLKTWRKKAPKLNDQLETIENLIVQDQLKPYSPQNHSLQEDLIHQHHQIMIKQSEYHKQRVKKVWAIKGDRNTIFFQRAILKRATKNRIAYLVQEHGSPVTTQDQMACVFKNYFTNLFSSQYADHNDRQGAQQQTWEEETIQDDFTNSIPDKHEILQIVKGMRSDASPGPDGLNAGFYKAAWP
ncbi:hypothetical protein BS78_01G221600 [Paspalum vaginatum]|nr:hypothetical protein BS78_01G221600 [Paspalum vaginatum]